VERSIQMTSNRLHRDSVVTLHKPNYKLVASGALRANKELSERSGVVAMMVLESRSTESSGSPTPENYRTAVVQLATRQLLTTSS
jgi:hypothetical protein